MNSKQIKTVMDSFKFRQFTMAQWEAAKLTAIVCNQPELAAEILDEMNRLEDAEQAVRNAQWADDYSRNLDGSTIPWR